MRSIGNHVTLAYIAGHVGDDNDANYYSAPEVKWYKDGYLFRSISAYTANSNGRARTTLSFIFQESDAGVYQCIFFTDTSVMYGTIPVRVDTGIIRIFSRFVLKR